MQETSATITQLYASDNTQASILAAIAELRACSDAELADLGITRGEIAFAVRHGREGYEHSVTSQGREQAA